MITFVIIAAACTSNYKGLYLLDWWLQPVLPLEPVEGLVKVVDLTPFRFTEILCGEYSPIITNDSACDQWRGLMNLGYSNTDLRGSLLMRKGSRISAKPMLLSFRNSI